MNESTFHAVITVVTLAMDAIVVSQAGIMLKSVCIVTCLSTCRVGDSGLEGSSSTGLLACPAAGVLPSHPGGCGSQALGGRRCLLRSHDVGGRYADVVGDPV